MDDETIDDEAITDRDHLGMRVGTPSNDGDDSSTSRNGDDRTRERRGGWHDGDDVSPHHRTRAGSTHDGDRDNSTGAAGKADPASSAWSGRRVGLVALVLAGLVSTVFLTRGGERPPVVVTVRAGVSWSAPDAPSHQVVRRWEWVAPTRSSLAGIAVLDDRVLAQTISLDRGRDPVVATVISLDTTSGDVVWTADVPMSRSDGPRSLELNPTIHVVGDTTATTIPTSNGALPAGDSTGLDANTGEIIWTQDLQLGDPVHVGDRLLGVGVTEVETEAERPPIPTSTVVDLHTGDVALVADGVLFPTNTGWASYDWSPDGTLTTTMLNPQGHPTTIATDGPPVILDAMVITATDATVVAHDLDGRAMWEVAVTDPTTASNEASGDVETFTELRALDETEVLATTHRTSETAGLVGLDFHRVDVDGAATPIDSPPLQRIVDAGSLVTIDQDDQSRVLCVTDPAVHTNSNTPACPGDVAVLDMEGNVTAQIDVDGGLETHLSVNPRLGGIATHPGLIVAEPRSIALRSWGNLEPLWRIEVNDRTPGAIAVATSERGVAVGTSWPIPSTVTWLS